MTRSADISLDHIAELVISAKKFFDDDQLKSDVHTKGPIDFVTEVDFHVQAYLQEKLSADYPDIQFMGEEKNNDEIDFTGLVWILDPVDGTANLVHDLNASAISLGLCDNGKNVLGVVYNPFTDELFTAKKGEGAFLNGKPIHVTDAPDLAHCMVAGGTSANHRQMTDWTFDCLKELFNRSEDIRLIGSAAIILTDVAVGRFGAIFQRYLMPWDYAASQIIIEEAGGIVRDFYGNEPPCDRPSSIIAAANENMMKEMFEIFKPVE